MFKGAKIMLRSVQLSDAILLLKWENNPANWSVSSTKSKYTLSDMIHLIESMEDIETAKQARFIIINKTSGIALGAIDLFSINFDEESASVGILIADKENRNKGVASAAIIFLEEVCSQELGIYNLKAVVHQANLASVRLFEKVGFSKKKLTQDVQLKNADYIKTLNFEKWLKK